MSNSFKPDIALVDIQLADGDTGYEVGQSLKELLPNVFLVAHTGYHPLHFEQKARNAGFDAYLIKPWDDAALLEILARADRHDRRWR